jgi:hypothetical protein
MEFERTQRYTNTYPIRYAVTPRQPMLGKRTVSTISTIFQYDIISPYGVGDPVSNPDQDIMFMVGWGMICRVAILAPGNATLTIQVDLVGDGTFTEIDTSPIAIALSAKVQIFTFPVLPCAKLRARLTGDGSTYTFHSSLTDY